MYNKSKNYKMIILSLFIAILLLQTIIPGIGYIQLGPLSISVIPITVVAVTLSLGLKEGLIIGFLWGFIVFIRAFFWPTSLIAQIVFVNPVISIIPRMLIALFSYIAFKYLSNKISINYKYMISGIVGSLTNTIFVLSFIYFFYKDKSTVLYGVSTDHLLPFLSGIVLTNGVPEMIIAAVLLPLIMKVLSRIIK
ncbi:ECF transporter S component [Lactobacillus sp. S2-2]|uniref:ECF transporter S component n=1 Tax=Lactobacillus sp. S2-2 TaxID=2692917 RepID=UPI001F028914|nr:ECF transporter S component [Lactobacillus sp. S2-2]MCF6514799.1 ECF transporter S component [Lactobacillus sp. S2-2]